MTANIKFFGMHLNWSDQTRWRVDILLKYLLKNEFSQAMNRNQLTFIDYRFIESTHRHLWHEAAQRAFN